VRGRLWPAVLVIAVAAIGCAREAGTPPATTAPIAASTSTPTAAPKTTPGTPVAATKLEVGVGSAPPSGWKWAVAEFDTGAEAGDGPHTHDFAWVFYTIKGSADVSMGGASKTIGAGGGVLIPAREQHSHRYLPQSIMIGFHLRPVDQPPGALHRGTTILVSDKPLDLRDGVDYKVRVQEFTFPGNAQQSERLTANPNFAYLAEGSLAITSGGSSKAIEARKPIVLPVNEPYLVANPGTSPARLVVVDVHP
jgi:mannose-6-phosphate isomerase-like protein (cupin superfamily)